MKVVAIVRCRCKGTADLASATTPSYLEVLYIKTDPNAAQKGLGRLVMAVMLEAAHGAGFDLTLSHVAKNTNLKGTNMGGETFFTRLGFSGEMSSKGERLLKMPYHEGGTVKQFDNTKLLEMSLTETDECPLTIAVARRYLEGSYSLAQLAKPYQAEGAAAAHATELQNPEKDRSMASSDEEASGRRRRGGNNAVQFDARPAIDSVNAELNATGYGAVSALALISESASLCAPTMALFKVTSLLIPSLFHCDLGFSL